jgi:glycosyltransferase involved in cell wall biosynthesis
VVDDGSTIPIEPTVRLFDERFVYLRSDTNAGCTSARLLGCAAMRGRMLAQLDSDNTLYPWALERATALLDRTPDVDGVAGLYVYDEGLPMRVAAGSLIQGPGEYARRAAPPRDSVGVVRREVAEEWAQEVPAFYNLDFALWLLFRLRHRMLFVDEVWGRYYSSADHRISEAPDARRITDVVRFVETYRPILGDTPCIPLDEYLQRRWFALLRAGHRAEAQLVAAWMRSRGITRSRTVLQLARAKAARATPSPATPYRL